MKKSQFAGCMNERLSFSYCQKYQEDQICVHIKDNKKHTKSVRKRRKKVIKNAIIWVLTVIFAILLFIIGDTDSKACVLETESYYVEQAESTRKFKREENNEENGQENNSEQVAEETESEVETIISDESITDETETIAVTEIPQETMEIVTEPEEDYKPIKLAEYKISADGPYKNLVYILSEQDMMDIAKLVWAEARGECYEGKVAVAAVVLNRYFSTNPIFHRSSISATLKQEGQFASINGVTEWDLNNVPDCIKAVEDACKGWDPTREVFEEGALYFYNPTKVYGWQAQVRENIKVMVIGNHNFHFDFEKVEE